MTVQLPLGIDLFDKLRTDGYYYVDKTELIHEVLDTKFEVSLITRPRRFGKTLMMSMLETFFDISRDSKAIFEGLKISRERALCEEWMNQWPTVFVSLKSAEGLNFKDAYGMLTILIANLYKKYAFLGESDAVDKDDRNLFLKIKRREAELVELKDSLLLLTRMMHAHYGKKVILLIDEYDVPLSKAYDNDYYREMLDIIRVMLGSALKTNPYLKFSVIMGCLKISKESIFTGLNNVVSNTITTERFNEYFGFTENDIQKLLADTGLTDHADEMRAWYDGYHFGRADVYCPWDVLNHAAALQADPYAQPRAYWANTSGNSILKRFLKMASRTTKVEIEKLINGEYISKRINEQLTYDELESSIGNMWSFLYLTGYLTGKKSERGQSEVVELAIPNREVREVFMSQIVEWFTEEIVVSQHEKLTAFCQALKTGDISTAQSIFDAFLKRGISVRDTFVKKNRKENFYHGILLGLLMSADGWYVRSNHEDGDGYSDIHVEIDEEDIAFVIEVKYAENDALDAACSEAMKQIEKMKYLEGLEELGFSTIYAYGIACYKKHCKIVRREMLQQLK
ncbi:MAG: AAA family ATPase [Lachnospiraceae bacterium]|nr:AAA family ATPase [Lachnospiraceae bacterium]